MGSYKVAVKGVTVQKEVLKTKLIEKRLVIEWVVKEGLVKKRLAIGEMVKKNTIKEKAAKYKTVVQRERIKFRLQLHGTGYIFTSDNSDLSDTNFAPIMWWLQGTRYLSVPVVFPATRHQNYSVL